MQQLRPRYERDKRIQVSRYTEHRAQGQYAGAEVGNCQRVLLCSELLPEHECDLLVIFRRNMARKLPRL